MQSAVLVRDLLFLSRGFLQSIQLCQCLGKNDHEPACTFAGALAAASLALRTAALWKDLQYAITSDISISFLSAKPCTTHDLPKLATYEQQCSMLLKHRTAA